MSNIDHVNESALKWSRDTGIEIICETGDLFQLHKMWTNWNKMPKELQLESDRKSLELFGINNEKHFSKISKEAKYDGFPFILHQHNPRNGSEHYDLRFIDLKNPKSNRKNAGFTDEERGKMTALLSSGFTDTYRYFYPDTEGVYSWWSYRFRAREKNAGWRIDYFITSKSIDDKLVSADIHTEILGSDHCPVELTVDL